eukprot:CAMPEP_0194080750 /NCGR_PEP_ID=MMETSP0149-20130528/6694_1 /TAXON_ID=122233 /ORGANISM="Chaetoceros debilis, Strain MM31A-1" /LENGTH=299 /DNA_ID=CAMNT_0038762529 /DNA_START=14 /DNA_END=910 /DNA_ORIENTATION=-
MADQKLHPSLSRPSAQSVAFVLTVTAASIATLPNIFSTIDSVATIEICTTPLFPEYLSRSSLGWIRLGFSFFIGIVAVCRCFGPMIALHVHYLKGSKLTRSLVFVGGLRTQAMFTSWSWNLLGISFAFSGLLTLYVDDSSRKYNRDEMMALPYIQWALRASILLFEISAPVAMLVSAVIKYAIWPRALASKEGNTSSLKDNLTLFQHNSNIIMSLMEAGLLGGLPIRLADIALAPLFGVTYIFFSWGMRFKWIPGETHFIYFFLDTTLGKTSTIALMALTAILMMFHGIFTLVDDFIAL